MKPAELRNIRSRLGWSQRKMARRVGVSARQLQRYEHGQAAIPEKVANSARWVQDTESGVR